MPVMASTSLRECDMSVRWGVCQVDDSAPYMGEYGKLRETNHNTNEKRRAGSSVKLTGIIEGKGPAEESFYNHVSVMG